MGIGHGKTVRGEMYFVLREGLARCAKNAELIERVVMSRARLAPLAHTSRTKSSPGRKHRQHDSPGKPRHGSKRIFNSRWFIPAMHHAIGTFFVSPCSVMIPFRAVHQFSKGLCLALLKQIARLLPPEDVKGRVAPWRALVFSFPH